jgi:hypothetical protein
MRYDLTVPLRDLNGVQLTDQADPVGYTLRSVLIRTALFIAPGKAPTATDKLSAYALAKRIATANHFIDLSAEQVLFLKDNAGALWTPLVMGQVWELLESPVQLIPTEAPRYMDPPTQWMEGPLAVPPDKPTADIPTEA